MAIFLNASKKPILYNIKLVLFFPIDSFYEKGNVLPRKKKGIEYKLQTLNI